MTSAKAQLCTVDSIGFEKCVIDMTEHVIPIYAGYTGTPDSVKIEVTGLDYSFQTQYFRMFQHFINPSNINTFHFPIYNVDKTPDSIDVKITLIGNTCNSASDFLMKTLIIDDPVCYCQDYWVLSGALNKNESYYAETYISSTQQILTGNSVLYSAKTYIEWGDGFTVEDGAILEVNHTGCTIN
jgi:hypothetical protein